MKMDRLLDLLEAGCVDISEKPVGNGTLYTVSAAFNRKEARKLITQWAASQRTEGEGQI